jgi:hypothetical protein
MVEDFFADQLRLGIAPLLVNAGSHSEFKQYLFNGLWGIWTAPFMVLCKAEFITDQYG